MQARDSSLSELIQKKMNLHKKRNKQKKGINKTVTVYVPARFSSLSGLENGRSVLACLNTWYASCDSCACIKGRCSIGLRDNAVSILGTPLAIAAHVLRDDAVLY